MLLQSPSRILKSDFRPWESFGNYSSSDIFPEDEPSAVLTNCREILLETSASCNLRFEEETALLILPLYGEIIINNYYECISAGEMIMVKISAGEEISAKNHVLNDRADILIFEFSPHFVSEKYLKKSLDFPLNQLLQITMGRELTVMLGLYEGRREGFYQLQKSDSKIFGIVLNGAFEFQNRLLENRDAIILSEIDALEFEALSEDALILFLEI